MSNTNTKAGQKQRRSGMTLACCLALAIGGSITPLLRGAESGPALISAEAAELPLHPNFDLFHPPGFESAGPLIGEWTRTAGPGTCVVLASSDFVPSVEARIFTQSSISDAVVYERPLMAVDGLGGVLRIPSEIAAWQMLLIWPKSGEGAGPPVAINRTEAWWLGSNVVSAGEVVSVYGRNLSRRNETSESFLYLKPRIGAGQWVVPLSVNPYCVSFVFPAVAQGEYQLWMHNGHGGRYGWSEPLSLVLHNSLGDDRGRVVVNVRDYGARGDGFSDDTSSLQRAIAAANEKRPATLYFPRGSYVAHAALYAPPNVTWRGDGSDQSVIKVGGRFASGADVAFVVAQNGGGGLEFKQLRLDHNGGLGEKKLISLRGHDRIVFDQVAFLAGKSTLDLHDNTRLRITRCSITGAGIFLGSSRQVSVRENSFQLSHLSASAIVSWGGEGIAIVGNTAKDLDVNSRSPDDFGSGRFFISQGHFGSTRNVYVAENRTESLAPPDLPGVDQNQGEQILFEEANPVAVLRPDSSGTDYIRFNTAAPYRGLDVAIVKGRGVGQTRRIVAVTNNTIHVAPAFREIPDTTSEIAIVPMQSHTVIYRNVLDGKDGYLTRYSASVGISLYGNSSNNVIVENRMTRLRGGLLVDCVWLDPNSTRNAGGVFFNLIEKNISEGSLTGIGMFTVLERETDPASIGHFGNVYRHNVLTGLRGTAIRVALGSHFSSGHPGSDVEKVVYEHNRFVAEMEGGATVQVKGVLRAEAVLLLNNTFEVSGVGALTSPFDTDAKGDESIFAYQNQWINFKAPSLIDRVVPLARLVPANGVAPSNARIHRNP